MAYVSAVMPYKKQSEVPKLPPDDTLVVPAKTYKGVLSTPKFSDPSQQIASAASYYEQKMGGSYANQQANANALFGLGYGQSGLSSIGGIPDSVIQAGLEAQAYKKSVPSMLTYSPKKITPLASLTPEQIKAIKDGAMDHLLDKEDQAPVELEVVTVPTGRKFRDED